MLKKIVYLAMVLAFGVPAFAQSVTISPRKTVYRRPKPLHDFKKTFTVVRPVAKAATPALSRRITAAIIPNGFST